jgi:glutamyl-Q tRNA(Asp) synthetase
MSPEVTRFAPSPSGYLHLGHAYAALFAARAAADCGRFLLRIEDIDIARARPEYEDAICEDLAWLGLNWETPLRRQSTQLADYRAALAQLERRGLTYPCFCTRKEIAAEIERAGAAPHGRSAKVYPGTCRRLDAAERQARIDGGEAFALRLDMTAALAAAQAGAGGAALTWLDLGRGPQVCDPRPEGDIVLARKDVPASYHLSVVVDDAAQGVTLVTRGADLFDASHVHRLLQELLDLPVPRYHHHRLITDASGERLAKRADALSLRALRAAGHSPAEVIAMTGLEQMEERTTP